MRRELGVAFLVVTALIVHSDVVRAAPRGQHPGSHGGQGEARPAPGPPTATPPVTPPPSTESRFRSTLRFDPPQTDTERTGIPSPVGRIGEPFGFVTPWLWDGRIRTGGGYAQLPYPLPSGAAPGGVQLDVQPWRAEVYVDGTYTGVVRDFTGYYHHLEISAGPHVIAIVTADYEPLILDLIISPGHVTTYRGTLSLASGH